LLREPAILDVCSIRLRWQNPLRLALLASENPGSGYKSFRLTSYA
jgi:hypothetical protein